MPAKILAEACPYCRRLPRYNPSQFPDRWGMQRKIIQRPWPPGFFWPGCPCCIEETNDCIACLDGAPVKWSLSVDPISDDACSNCSGFGGNFTLIHRGSCLWNTDARGLCEDPFGNDARYTLDTDGAGNMQLLAEFSTAKYRIALTSFDCLGTNVLDFLSNTVRCSGWPSTVTITPI